MPGTTCLGGLRIPEDVDVVYDGEHALALEPRAVRLLRYLVRHGARVVSKRELLDQVWPDVVTSEGVVKRAVSLIRRTLRDAGPDVGDIQTYHRRGYRFVASRAPGAAAATPTGATHAARLSPHEPRPPSAQALPASAKLGAVSTPNFDIFVGRSAEQEFLFVEFQRAQHRQGRPVLVLGEAGSGKTQLALRLAERVAAQAGRALVARFRDEDGAREAACQPLLLALAEALDVPLAELPAAAHARLDVRLPDDLFATAASSSPSATSLGVLADAFVRVSRRDTLLLVLDDLQWASACALALLERLMRAARDERLLLVALARREDAERKGAALLDWLKRQATYRTFVDLRLQPLSLADLNALVASACQTRPDDTPVHVDDLARLHQVTGGNAYYMVELLRGFVLEGRLRPTPGPGRRWLCDRGRALVLPATLVLAAQVRLEAVRPEVRACLDAAAVLGDGLRLRPLAEITGYDLDQLDGLAREAEAQGVLTRRDLSPDDDYRFDPALLRQVAYDALAPERRRELHALAARTLIGAHALDPEPAAETIGMHCERAGDAEGAFAWSQRAWQVAATRGAWRQAQDCVERARRAAQELEGRGALPASSRLTLRLQAGETLRCVGLLPDSEQALLEAFRLAEAKGEEERRAEALVQLGRTRLAQGRYPDARPCFERALDLLRQKALPQRRAACLIDLAALRTAQGDYTEVAELLTAELPQLDESGARAARGLLGWALVLGGRATQGLPVLRQALEQCGAAGDVAGQALLLRRLHWAELSRGRCGSAFDYASRAIAAARARGDALGEAKSRMGAGQCLLAMGRVDEACAWIERAQADLAPLGDRHCAAEALWLHGQAQRESGRLEAAASELADALEVVRSVGDRDDEFRVLVDLARVENAAGRPWNARQQAEQAATIASELRNADGLGAARAEQAEAARLLGDLAGAASAAGEAVKLLDGSGAGERWRAHGALGRTWLARASAAPSEERGVQRGLALAELELATELLYALHEQAATRDLEPDAPVTRGATRRPRSWSALLDDTRTALGAEGREAEAAALVQRWGLELAPTRVRGSLPVGSVRDAPEGARNATVATHQVRLDLG